MSISVPLFSSCPLSTPFGSSWHHSLSRLLGRFTHDYRHTHSLSLSHTHGWWDGMMEKERVSKAKVCLRFPSVTYPPSSIICFVYRNNFPFFAISTSVTPPPSDARRWQIQESYLKVGLPADPKGQQSARQLGEYRGQYVVSLVKGEWPGVVHEPELW